MRPGVKAILLAGVLLLITTVLGTMLATVLPALLLSGWFPLISVWDYPTVIGIFLAAGAVLWTTFYVIFATLAPQGAPLTSGRLVNAGTVRLRDHGTQALVLLRVDARHRSLERNP